MGNCATKPKVKKDPDEASAPPPAAAPETPVERRREAVEAAEMVPRSDKGKQIVVEGDDGAEMGYNKRPSLSHLFMELVQDESNETKENEKIQTEAAKTEMIEQIGLAEKRKPEAFVPDSSEIKVSEVSAEKLPKAKAPGMQVEKAIRFSGNKTSVSETLKPKGSVPESLEIKVPEVSTETLAEVETPKFSVVQIPKISGNQTGPQTLKPDGRVSESLEIKPLEAKTSEIPGSQIDPLETFKMEASVPESSEIKVPEASTLKLSKAKTLEIPAEHIQPISENQALKSEAFVPPVSTEEFPEAKTSKISAEQNPQAPVFFDAHEKIEPEKLNEFTPSKETSTKAQNEKM